MAPIEFRISNNGLELRIVSLEPGALPACPFTAGTLITSIRRAVYLFVHCGHFMALSMSFYYRITPQVPVLSHGR